MTICSLTFVCDIINNVFLLNNSALCAEDNVRKCSSKFSCDAVRNADYKEGMREADVWKKT